MRALVLACGSRGDFQPMLALAVALRNRGHEVFLAGSPTFASEAAAFGIPFEPAGMDARRVLEENRERVNHRNPFDAVRVLNRVMLDEVRSQSEVFPSLARRSDLVVGGGAILAGRDAAEAAGIPYRYVGYTPQILPSAHHVPIMLPWIRTPRLVNRLGWWGMRVFYNRFFLASLLEYRRGLGLPPVSSIIDHIFSPELSFVAADPELAPLPPDLDIPQVGSFFLPDERPLPPELERFLAEGEPPVYIGFGSMPDAEPEQTTRLISEAVRRAGCRAVLSSGWAGFGAEGLGKDVHVVGPLSHGLLFPRMSGVVHHGGAGTTAASARAGVPQVVVPHAFDQFMMAHYVRRAGLGTSVPRNRLSVEGLARALVQIRQDESMQARAARVGERIRARSPLDAAVTLLEEVVRAPSEPAAAPVRVA